MPLLFILTVIETWHACYYSVVVSDVLLEINPFIECLEMKLRTDKSGFVLTYK